MTKYKIIIKKAAEKFIEKQPPKQQKRIIEAIMKLPYEGDIDTYKAHEGYFRLRVGNYRILYTVDHGVLTVTIANADNRGQVYK
ncbi:MAG: type II toxin-antitoxin system RelE/ParE family toxin [Ruminococcus sp.]|nr:type II toxin-antitoxin system RelE/ParE family toxin [Ruminococcus sp.]